MEELVLMLRVIHKPRPAGKLLNIWEYVSLLDPVVMMHHLGPRLNVEEKVLDILCVEVFVRDIGYIRRLLENSIQPSYDSIMRVCHLRGALDVAKRSLSI